MDRRLLQLRVGHHCRKGGRGGSRHGGCCRGGIRLLGRELVLLLRLAVLRQLRQAVLLLLVRGHVRTLLRQTVLLLLRQGVLLLLRQAVLLLRQGRGARQWRGQQR